MAYSPLHLVLCSPVSSLIHKGQGSEFHMKYHILQDSRTSTPFEEKSSDHFKNLHKMKLLSNFDINLTSFLGGVIY